VSHALGIAAALVALGIVLVLARARRRSASPGFVLGGGLAALAAVAVAALVDFHIIPSIYIDFTAPWIVVLGAPLLLLAALRLGELSERMGRGRGRLVRLASFMALLLGVLAAAGPKIGVPNDALAVVFVVDRSRSIDLVPSAERRISDEVRAAESGMRDDDRVGTITFAAEAQVSCPLRPRSTLAPHGEPALARDATSLEAGLRLALAELPPDRAGRLVLLSDGVETRDDTMAAVAAAMAKDVPIDVLPLVQEKRENIRVVSVRGPARADEDEAFDLRVVLASSARADVLVRIQRDGAPFRETKVTVGGGEDVLRVRDVGRGPGLHRYDVAVSAADPRADDTPDDNAGSAFVRVRGVSLALVLEGYPGQAAPLTSALEGAGFRVKQGGAADAPRDVEGFAPYDLVVLSDVRASELAGSAVDALATYTRDLGGGLLLLGGDRSFGPGGYARTALEEVSPVSFDLRQKQRRASLAEVITIDYSGSMGMVVAGQTKLALANEAAARSASLLGPGDQLGVAHVDTVVAWTHPLGPVTSAEAIAAKVRKVGVGGGGIYTDLALKASYDALDRATAMLKHVLLFADGSDAEQLAGCRALVQAAHARGITTSVISLGEGTDSPELSELAKLGQGRFYLIVDAAKLPEVFSQETVLASRSAIVEKPFVAKHVGGGPATRGIDLTGAPPLEGYVVTRAKPRAEVLLTGPDDDPVLATWAVGLGRAAAFTSDYKNRWGRAWTAYAPAGKLFGQLARDTARREDDPRAKLEADTSDGSLKLRADLLTPDGRADSLRALHAKVVDPTGAVTDVPLAATGPGRYGADVPLGRKGTYVATLVDDTKNEVMATAGAVLGEGHELTMTGTDRALLERIATMTGGHVRSDLRGVFVERGRRAFVAAPLARVLSLASAVLLVASVAARKLGIPEVVGRALARLRTRRQARADERARARAARDEATTSLAERTFALAKKATRKDERPLPPAALPPPKPAPAPKHDAPSTSAAPGAPPGPARELSAAERIALKRREKKS